MTIALDVVDLPLVERRHRDQVLGEHVERVLRDRRLLDLPFAHPPRDHRALEQVAAVFGEDPAFRGLADAVPGAADPLQAAGHRLRRLDLDDEVDGAHVDPQLQRGGGDQAGELARLQHLLDQGPLLVGERAVVGAGDLDLLERLAGVGVAGAGRLVVAAVLGGRQLPLAFAVGELVQSFGEALGGAAVVDEDDRRGVFLDQLAAAPGRSPARSTARGRSARFRSAAPSRPRSDRRARPGRPCPRPARRSRCRGLSACPASTILHLRLGPTRNLAIRSRGRWVAERPMRWMPEGPCSKAAGPVAAAPSSGMPRDAAPSRAMPAGCVPRPGRRGAPG